MPDTLPSQPITIFCSYARADKIYKDALEKALAVPINSGIRLILRILFC
jgi:hypothetical protein